MRKCVRAISNPVRGALRKLEQDTTPRVRRPTGLYTTNAFTVADKTLILIPIVFRVAVDRNLDVPVQEGRVGHLHTCMACLLVEGPVTLSSIVGLYTLNPFRYRHATLRVQWL